VKGSTLKVYPGLSHGMCTINKDQINSDLLAFIQA
jgi:non-heme chloroperoxidase